MPIKIKNAFKKAEQLGVPYESTLAFVTNDFKAYHDKNGRKLADVGRILKNVFMNENLVYQQVCKFIKSKNIDMDKFINELRTESTVLVPEKEESEGKEMNNIKSEELTTEDLDEMLKGVHKEAREDDESEYDLQGAIEEPKEFEEYEELETDEEEKEDNEQPKNKKAKELEEKIDALCEKISQETNPLKRHLNQFLVRQLKAKLDREIEKLQIKEEYNIRKQELLNKKNRKEENLESQIDVLTKKQRALKKKLKANEEYDYGSKNFTYPKDWIERKGGIDKFVEKLENSDKAEKKYTANQIRKMVETREQLAEVKRQLNEANRKLSDLDRVYDRKEKNLKIEEKSLTIKNNNPINVIKNWFRNAFTEIKDFWNERKEDKMDRKANELSRQGELQEIEAGYQEELEALKERYERRKEEIIQEYKEANEQYQSEKRHEKLREFQESAGIKVSPDQLIESNNPEQQPSPVNDLENDNIQNSQDDYEEELAGEEH